MVDTPLPGIDPSAPARVAPAHTKEFLLAGNATFTVRSAKTNTRYTFKVRKPTKVSPHFVSLMSGPDNHASFQFIGTIFDGGTDRERYEHGKRSRITEDSVAAKAARWVVLKVLRGEELTNCELWHEGRCGKCGRKLTVPESIELGLGPECAANMMGGRSIPTVSRVRPVRGILKTVSENADGSSTTRY